MLAEQRASGFLNVQENHYVVAVDVELEGVVCKYVVVAEATLDALKPERGMHREQAIFLELRCGHGRQAGAG